MRSKMGWTGWRIPFAPTVQHRGKMIRASLVNPGLEEQSVNHIE
jgi:hypothetical protein